jgi:hypothetical protein
MARRYRFKRDVRTVKTNMPNTRERGDTPPRLLTFSSSGDHKTVVLIFDQPVVLVGDIPLWIDDAPPASHTLVAPNKITATWAAAQPLDSVPQTSLDDVPWDVRGLDGQIAIHDAELVLEYV